MNDAMRESRRLALGRHETISPQTLAVLCVVQKLQATKGRVAVTQVARTLGVSVGNVHVRLRKLAEAGLIRRQGHSSSGVAVACVFIPGERR